MKQGSEESPQYNMNSFSEFIRNAAQRAFSAESAKNSHGGESQTKTSSPSKLQFSINNCSVGAISPFSKSGPSGFLSGMSNGINDLAIGILGGATIFLASPIIAGSFGYQQLGIGGGVGGAVLGALIGWPCSYCLALGGIASCLIQIVLGIIRSPSSTYASCFGYLWDELSEVWAASNLAVDEVKYLGLSSQSDFLRQLSKSSLYQVRSLMNGLNRNSPSNPDPSDNESNKNNSSEQKKSFEDAKDLYGLLGIDSNASSRDIKKAYRTRALKYHPDRCSGQSERDIKLAQSRFQQIGQAYSVLSDDHMRRVYDNRKVDSIGDGTSFSSEEITPRSFDTTAVYSNLFGSVVFEDLIGELELSSSIKAMIQGDAALILGSIKVRNFIQQQRETRVSLNLVSKLNKFISMESYESQTIRSAMDNDLADIGEGPLGSLLLSVIGGCYAKAVARDMYPYQNYSLNVDVQKSSVWSWLFPQWYELLESCIEVLKAVSTGCALLTYRRKLQLKYKNDEQETEVTSNPLSYVPGPEISSLERFELESKTKQFIEHTMNVIWRLVREDVAATLDHACTRVLRDVSVSPEMRTQRRRMMNLLAVSYLEKGQPSVPQGLEPIIKTLSNSLK